MLTRDLRSSIPFTVRSDTMSFTPRTLGSNKFRLHANSTRELTEAFERLATRYGVQHPFKGRKLKTGPMLNVVVLHFLLLPEAERIALLERTIPELEKMLGGAEDLASFLEQVDPQRPSWAPAREASVPPGKGSTMGQEQEKKLG
jgi:hypothetical protein